MPITPLPQFEADLAEHLKEKADREAYERLNTPSTLVVRFGVMLMVGEFPYRGDAKPGCGSKIVVRTHRGIEMGEMLTSTCPNSGCSKSVSRKEMLEYIENSGGRDYPFHADGMALRVATKEDMDRQAAIDASRTELVKRARRVAESLHLPVRVVEAEPLLGNERITYYYTALSGDERDRVEAHALQQELRRFHDCRVEVRQVGARDEARLTADYERCGQYCCCKNFLKVLKPVSMRSAKVQKATLDPLKISGRCGRLMCCLRYEDETYEELRKRLPNRKKRVGTPDGDGTVIDSQILTQLVLVRLDETNRDVAVPVEELTEPGEPRAVRAKAEPTPRPARPARRERPDRTPTARAASEPERAPRPAPGEASGEAPPRKRRKKRRDGEPAPDAERGRTSGGSEVDRIMNELGLAPGEGSPTKKKRRRKRRPEGEGGREPGAEGGTRSPDAPATDPATGSSQQGGAGPGPHADGDRAAERGDGAPKKRRRRRRKPGGGSGGQAGEGGGGASDPS
ncbi:MAG: hypothetical protein EA378_06690 [Phycisphaerales bacterium]|nr:MAG: hypothetical protein EA378_06690 [Phycisphaerales bacterium]